jgi:hypothetical protein
LGLNTLSDKPPMVSKCRGTPINGVMVCMKRGRSGALEALLCTGWGLGICSIALLQSSPSNSPPGFKLVGRLRDGGVTIRSVDSIGGNWWQLALGLLNWTAANGSDSRRVATRIGLPQLNGSKWQRVATRFGPPQLDGRGWQRVATRTELAQLDGCGWQRMAASGNSHWACSAGRQQMAASGNSHWACSAG